MKLLKLTTKEKKSSMQKDIQRYLDESNNIKVDIINYMDIYFDGEFKDINTGNKLQDYDLYRTVGRDDHDIKKGFNLYLNLNNKKIIDKINQNITDFSKFGQIIYFSHYNINYPKSLFFYISKRNISKYIDIIEQTFEYPIIAKDVFLNKGKGIFLIKSREMLEELVLNNQNKGLLFQEFVKNDGYYRITIIGDNTLGILKRREKQFEPSELPRQKSVPGELPKKLEQTLTQFINKIGLDIAGIDLLFDGEKYHILEVNHNPGYGVFERLTQTNYIGSILKYFEKL